MYNLIIIYMKSKLVIKLILYILRGDTMRMPKFAILKRIRNGKRTYAITPRIPDGFVSHKTLLKITTNVDSD